MSSRTKFIYLIFISLLIVTFFSSCEKKQEKPVSFAVSPDSALKIDKAILADYAQRTLGDKIKIYDYGIYEADSSKGLIAGKEFAGKEWGMKFYYLKLINNQPKLVYETKLLNGSLSECLVKKIKMMNYNYEMIYYDSQDYFMGSSGGEIFTYIIDLNDKTINYAHFFTTPDKPVSLYLSGNITRMEIRDFLTRHFQKDYPNLQITNRDIDLDKN